jgi:hypothetical protein
LVVCSERVVAGGGPLGNYLVFDRSPEVRVWEIDQHANAAAQIIAIISTLGAGRFYGLLGTRPCALRCMTASVSRTTFATKDSRLTPRRIFNLFGEGIMSRASC